jgi:outer membrane biosynthesis protein TonB
MDDAMLDLMADQGGLRRRLDAYAEVRLSPDLAATTRMRARVLSVAHRQAALARADAALSLVPDPSEMTTATTRPEVRRGTTRTAVRRTATIVLAATLALASVASIALAARPGGALYGARVWAETLVLPSDPRERAVAELARLEDRLAEAAAASAVGDVPALQAALLAYQHIVQEAGAAADVADDAVAEIAIQQGVADNIAVLSELVGSLPAGGSAAVQEALERAIERSEEAIESVKPGNGNGGGGSNAGGNDNGTGTPGGPNATPAPAASEAPEPTATPKPTKTPKPDTTPEATPKPTKTPKPDATPRPERTPRPTPDQGGAATGNESTPHSDPPGQSD